LGKEDLAMRRIYMKPKSESTASYVGLKG
jgi:hypothetical protein